MMRASVYAVMLALGISASVATEAQNTATNDEATIRRIVVVMTEEFNRHDAKAATQMYLPDAQFVTVRGEVMNGQSVIEKGLASIVGTRAKNATQRTLDVAVKFVRPDVALVHVKNELSGLVATDGQVLPSHQELSLRVFVKESGTWNVAAFQNTLIRPFGTP